MVYSPDRENRFVMKVYSSKAENKQASSCNISKQRIFSEISTQRILFLSIMHKICIGGVRCPFRTGAGSFSFGFFESVVWISMVSAFTSKGKIIRDITNDKKSMSFFINEIKILCKIRCFYLNKDNKK